MPTRVARYERRIPPAGKSPNLPYGDIEVAVNSKTALEHDKGRANVRKFTMNDFRIEGNHALSSSNGTMALHRDFPSRKDRLVVFVEWIRELDRDQKGYAETEASMLCAPKPAQLLLPGCYGIVEDPARARFGLVLVPPDHIRRHVPKFFSSREISKKRMPVSLKGILEQPTSRMDSIRSGIRFRLATKLLDAVHMMLSVGWIHECVNFFTTFYY